MEYLIGGIVSGLLVSFAFYVFNKTIIKNKPIRVSISQSRTHYMLAPILLKSPGKKKATQSLRHLEQNHIKVLFTGLYAYWIRDNAVYRADIKNGKIVEESTQKLDMMGMDKVQLNEMMFIVEQLTEGKNNDYWSSGN